MSTYDEDKIVGVNTVTCLRLNDVIYDLKSILLILNSELISWYAYRFVYNKAIRSMDLYDYFISKIPISNSLLKYQLLFNFVSECILYLNKNQPDSDYVNKFYFISNIIVFDMYFKNEIKTTLNDMFLQQVSQMHKLNQKVDLDSIKRFMNFFSSREIKEQITKILQNPNFHKITNNTFQN